MANLPLAFCGLGLMGGGMARRLLAAGFPLTLYNRDAAKAAALEGDGAKVAATPREAAAQTRIVFSMVADDNASRSVWLGENGALQGAAPGSPMLRLLADRMTDGDYTPHFLMRLMAKDLNYAITEGEQRSLKLTTAASALDLFRRAMALGLGEKDTAAVIELFHQRRDAR